MLDDARRCLEKTKGTEREEEEEEEERKKKKKKKKNEHEREELDYMRDDNDRALYGGMNE